MALCVQLRVTHPQVAGLGLALAPLTSMSSTRRSGPLSPGSPQVPACHHGCIPVPSRARGSWCSQQIFAERGASSLEKESRRLPLRCTASMRLPSLVSQLSPNPEDARWSAMAGRTGKGASGKPDNHVPPSARPAERPCTSCLKRSSGSTSRS